tara:strand:- start:130 stop:360 length:231 start_codon:yes stop_codon:yes gene_type:complete
LKKNNIAVTTYSSSSSPKIGLYKYNFDSLSYEFENNLFHKELLIIDILTIIILLFLFANSKVEDLISHVRADFGKQ